MRTLIVLCAGGRSINKLPIFLNRHPDGKLLAEKAIEGVFPESYDRIIYTMLQSDEEKYNAAKLVLDELENKYPVETILLPEKTKGPADSVYQTIVEAKIDGEFAVRDSLNGIYIADEISGNCIAGLDLTQYNDEVFNVKSKSFIIVNEQHQVLDVIEKKFRSDVISVGLYGFNKVSDFMLAYSNLCDPNYPIIKLYLSNIISYLIGYKQRVFHCANVLKHEDWGTKETWSRLQKNYATAFIDADKILDEYLSDKNISTLISKLEPFSGTQVSIVIFTRSKQVNKKRIYDLLDEKRIKCIDMVCGVSYSVEQLMISNDVQMEDAALGVL